MERKSYARGKSPMAASVSRSAVLGIGGVVATAACQSSPARATLRSTSASRRRNSSSRFTCSSRSGTSGSPGSMPRTKQTDNRMSAAVCAGTEVLSPIV
jgi:hypothetical protein